MLAKSIYRSWCLKQNPSIIDKLIVVSTKLTHITFRACNYLSSKIPRYAKRKIISYPTKYGFKLFLNVEDRGFPRDIIIKKGTRETIAEQLMIKIGRQAGKCIFLDIGCNYGFYSFLLAPYSRKIYAVEPNPDVLDLAKKAAELNNFTNIEFYNLAFGQKAGKAKFYVSTISNWSGFTPSVNVIKEIEVEVTTLDKFLENKELPQIIKMDVEGAEYEIIKGGEEVLSEPEIKYIFLELHWPILGEEKTKELLETLNSLGFSIKYVIYEHKQWCSFLLPIKFIDKVAFTYFYTFCKEKLNYSFLSPELLLPGTCNLVFINVPELILVKHA